MTEALFPPGHHISVPPETRLLSLDTRWSAGPQTAFSERIGVALLPLVRGRLVSREHLVFDNQPHTPDGSVRLGVHPGVVEIDLASISRDIERISLIAYVRPRPNAPRRTLDQLDALTMAVRDGLTDTTLGCSQNVANRLGAVAGATIADVLREGASWAVVIQATGHESGLEAAVATAGVRL